MREWGYAMHGFAGASSRRVLARQDGFAKARADGFRDGEVLPVHWGGKARFFLQRSPVPTGFAGGAPYSRVASPQHYRRIGHALSNQCCTSVAQRVRRGLRNKCRNSRNPGPGLCIIPEFGTSPAPANIILRAYIRFFRMTLLTPWAGITPLSRILERTSRIRRPFTGDNPWARSCMLETSGTT